MTTSTSTASENEFPDQATLLGHPTGLFTLFFAEMWERFSYYGMRALLMFYMINGFLKYNDEQAYAIYGAYGALVYATPYIGGMLADRLLGARRAVVIGGVLMALGHLVMMFENDLSFFTALALLIVGNGFFKPNISTIVGGLYPKNSKLRDGGFTVFYMGINLGAAMSPLLCAYIGKKYGFHYGFGLATIGMIVGLAVFVFPKGMARAMILLGALAGAAVLGWTASGFYMTPVHIVLAAALVFAGVLAFVALGRGALPTSVGAAKSESALKMPVHASVPWLSRQTAVYLGILLSIPLMVLLIQKSSVANILLLCLGGLAVILLLVEAGRVSIIERHRLFVVLVLMFFSMLFWAFFEQAGSSISLFTERNVDRAADTRRIETADVGSTINIELTQEQVGYEIGDRMFRLNHLDAAREEARVEEERLKADAEANPAKYAETNIAELAAQGRTIVPVLITKAHVGMAISTNEKEVAPSVFQSVNPLFILILGPLFTMLWTFLGRRRREPSTAVKFALGLAQLGLGFLALWYGAETADDRGLVWIGWLLLGYLLHTSGELCLSPVGLSMVVKLSPRRIVSTVLGAWFLATSISYLVGAEVAKLTGVDFEAGSGDMPVPSETVHTYGDVFLMVAITVGIASVLLFALSPLLTRWMHEGEEVPGEDGEAAAPSSGH